MDFRMTGHICRWAVILSLACLVDCGRQPSPQQGGAVRAGWNRLHYFPVLPGATWDFTGPFGRVIVGNWTDPPAGESTSTFRLDFVDSSSVPRLQETFTVAGDQVFWRDYRLPNFPQIVFDPPLPILPPSANPGDSLVVDSIERWEDSVRISFEVKAVQVVLGVEDIDVPAGTFENCIHVRQAILYRDRSLPHLFSWIELWYAKGVGWVRYDSQAGSGELITARVGEKHFP